MEISTQKKNKEILVMIKDQGLGIDLGRFKEFRKQSEKE